MPVIPVIQALWINRHTLVLLGDIAIVLVAVIVGIVITAGPSADDPPPLAETSASQDLGITYLRITPQVTAHYELGIKNGALVTGVVSDSLADRAGLREGDVILSYNGVTLGEETPLLGMIRDCRPGSDVVFEIWREDRSRLIQTVHTPR